MARSPASDASAATAVRQSARFPVAVASFADQRGRDGDGGGTAAGRRRFPRLSRDATTATAGLRSLRICGGAAAGATRGDWRRPRRFSAFQEEQNCVRCQGCKYALHWCFGCGDFYW